MRKRRRAGPWLLFVCSVASLLIVATISVCLQLRQDKLDTDLVAAIEARQLARAISLLKQGANANAARDSGTRKTPRQMLSALRARLRGKQVKEPEGLSALMLACSWGEAVGDEWKTIPADNALIRQLLEHGASANTTDPSLPMSALDSQVLQGNTLGVTLLVEHGANVNGRASYYHGTMLHEAARTENTQAIMGVLLAHGADINALDERGATPLMWAVSETLPGNVRCLVQRSADTSIEDEHGDSALDIAEARQDSAAERSIVKMLKTKQP